MTDAIAMATEHCLRALNARPAGLLTDIDGTISQIAPTPDSAIVDQLAKESLVTFAERLDVVGVITGRAAASAEQMPPAFPAVGLKTEATAGLPDH